MTSRFPRVDLPPLPEVRELDAHGNDVSDTQTKPRSQWAAQIQAAANASGKVTTFAQSKDCQPKPVIEVYEWPHIYKD